MNAPTRPVLRWHGGKWKLAPWIISHFPKHLVYVEPFGGAGSVLLRKPPVSTEVYNDLDGDLVNMFRVARDRAEELVRALSFTPYARDEYGTLYEVTNDPVERARRFIARSFMGAYSKGALQQSGFDSRIQDDACFGKLRALTSVPEELAAVAARFLKVIIENVDAVDLIARHDRTDALFYVDPPYISDAGNSTEYRHTLDEAGHSRLIERLCAVTGFVVLSGYQSKLYDAGLIGWRKLTSCAHADGSHARTEVLWLNPSCSSALDRDRGAGTLFAEVHNG